MRILENGGLVNLSELKIPHVSGSIPFFTTKMTESNAKKQYGAEKLNGTIYFPI